jgi:serine/threonine protein kinase
LGTDKEKQRFYKEVLILSQLRHPNIITLFGFVRKEDDAIMMVTELMTGGTLFVLRIFRSRAIANLSFLGQPLFKKQ